MTAQICFTVDNLGDAADLYRGNIAAPRKAGENPAFDTGYPALLELFSQFNVSITHFVEGWSARQYPDEIKRLISLGHKVGMHGWQHEPWSNLSEEEAFQLAQKATAAIIEAGGVQPAAFRAPGGEYPAYTDSILKKLGYSINASLATKHEIKNNPQPSSSSKISHIPYRWPGVDATHWLWDKRSCVETEEVWKKYLLEAAEQNDQFIFIWHPHIMGVDPEKLEVGKRILEFVFNDSAFDVIELSQLLTQSSQ